MAQSFGGPKGGEKTATAPHSCKQAAPRPPEAHAAPSKPATKAAPAPAPAAPGMDAGESPCVSVSVSAALPQQTEEEEEEEKEDPFAFTETGAEVSKPRGKQGQQVERPMLPPSAQARALQGDYPAPAARRVVFKDAVPRSAPVRPAPAAGQARTSGPTRRSVDMGINTDISGAAMSLSHLPPAELLQMQSALASILQAYLAPVQEVTHAVAEQFAALRSNIEKEVREGTLFENARGRKRAFTAEQDEPQKRGRR